MNVYFISLGSHGSYNTAVGIYVLNSSLATNHIAFMYDCLVLKTAILLVSTVWVFWVMSNCPFIGISV